MTRALLTYRRIVSSVFFFAYNSQITLLLITLKFVLIIRNASIKHNEKTREIRFEQNVAHVPSIAGHALIYNVYIRWQFLHNLAKVTSETWSAIYKKLWVTFMIYGGGGVRSLYR